MTAEDYDKLMQAVYAHNKKLMEQAAEAAKVPGLQTALTAAQTAQQTAEAALTAARDRLTAIKSNTLYTLLPSWIRDKLEAIL